MPWCHLCVPQGSKNSEVISAILAPTSLGQPDLLDPPGQDPLPPLVLELAWLWDQCWMLLFSSAVSTVLPFSSFVMDYSFPLVNLSICCSADPATFREESEGRGWVGL